jgi:flagellar hook-associated protein 2
MAGMSVDGLISGLNTTDLINQLMQAEAVPQTLLKNKVSAAQRVVSALQGVNSKFAALQTAAETMAKAATWSSVKAAATHASVSVSTAAGATGGALSFRVDQTAAAHTVVFGSAAVSLDAVVAGGSISVDHGGKPTPVAVGGGKLSEVVDAINRSDAGVRAVAVKADDGYRLQLTSTSSGQASAFTLTGVSGMGAPQATVVGRDAKIIVGAGSLAPYAVSSATNLFTEVLPGVSFTVSAKDVDVTVNVTADPDAVATRVQTMVDAANAALGEIKRAAAYDSEKKTGGALVGDGTVRQLSKHLVERVGAVPGLGSLAQVGIELTRDGTIDFDREAFLSALKDDPVKTQKFFTDGGGGQTSLSFADRLVSLAKQATDKDQGLLSLAIQGSNSLIKDLNLHVEDFDRRLELRRQTLQRQFTGMEVALSSMKQQSNWLAGQLGSLPRASN